MLLILLLFTVLLITAVMWVALFLAKWVPYSAANDNGTGNIRVNGRLYAHDIGVATMNLSQQTPFASSGNQSAASDPTAASWHIGMPIPGGYETFNPSGQTGVLAIPAYSVGAARLSAESERADWADESRRAGRDHASARGGELGRRCERSRPLYRQSDGQSGDYRMVPAAGVDAGRGPESGE